MPKPYDLETPTRNIKRLAGECPYDGTAVTGSAAYTGWHNALERVARNLYDNAGWYGRLVLYLMRHVTLVRD